MRSDTVATMLERQDKRGRHSSESRLSPRAELFIGQQETFTRTRNAIQLLWCSMAPSARGIVAAILE